MRPFKAECVSRAGDHLNVRKLDADGNVLLIESITSYEGQLRPAGFREAHTNLSRKDVRRLRDYLNRFLAKRVRR